MCGINIIINTTGKPIKESLAAMQSTTLYRGPDASADFEYNADGWQLAVGVNRLQVVDQDDASNQPMVSSCKNYVLAFNGEVYNYPDLKNTLIGLGYQFKTHSDTEVVLYWLQEFGAQGISALKGMYALAFINVPEKQVVIARDKHGIKPLFVCQSENMLIVSSSIKAVEASSLVDLTINKLAIADYLGYRHVMGSKTFYNEVVPHQPGLIIQYDNLFKKTISVVEELPEKEPTDLKQALIDATTLVYDSPASAGLLLSGGIDSTLILAMLRNEFGIRGINTFTMANSDDQKWARQAATQYDSHHHEVPVSMADFPRIDEFLANIDQPIADSGAFATWLVSAEAKKDSNILLSGAGADELFGGYNRHRAYNYYLHHRQRMLNIKKLVSKTGASGLLPKNMQQFLQAVEEDPVATYSNFLQNYAIKKNNPPEPLWKASNSPLDNLTQALNFDFQNYLVADVLAITDNATMQNSVETRVPYLYDDVVTIAGKISLAEKMKNNGKKPLKDLLAAYGGTKYNQRKKHGFGLPLAKWLRDKKTFWLWEFLIYDAPVFEFIPKSDIYRFLRLHQSGKKDYSMQLWSILVLEKWLSRTS